MLNLEVVKVAAMEVAEAVAVGVVAVAEITAEAMEAVVAAKVDLDLTIVMDHHLDVASVQMVLDPADPAE